MTVKVAQPHWIASRYSATCSTCMAPIQKGAPGFFSPDASAGQKMQCSVCVTDPPIPNPLPTPAKYSHWKKGSTPGHATPAPEPEPKPTPAPEPEPSDRVAQAMAILDALDLAAGPVKLDEKRVIDLIKKHAPSGPVPKTIRIQLVSTTAPPRDLDDAPRHVIFEDLLVAVQAGNVALVGPAGAGKTTVAKQIADVLEVGFFFNGAIASEYKLSGFKDAQGRYCRTQFREAYEHGGLYLFDEIDASLPGALLAFNAALANGHADFPDGRIDRHPKFYCIAAANTFGTGADRQYVGRNQLDAATLDRFIFLPMDYDETLERLIADNDAWTSRVQSVRKAIAKLKIRHVVSPRASITGAKLLAHVDQKKVENWLLWKNLDEGTQLKILAAM